MTSTNINIGFSDQRNSSKVLKPPGGGSSDIFGAANGSAASTPRSAPASKNHMVSNIFGAPQNRNGDTRRNTTADSHNRLFGEVERIQAQPGRVKSNIPFGNGDATDAPTSANGSNGHSKAAATVSSNGNGNGVASIVHAENGNGNGNGHHHHHHANGNGLNGNAGGARANGGGSDHHQNGNGTKHVFLRRRNGGNPVTGQGYRGGDSHSTAPTLNGSKQVINKNRIPPGGFSSGLW